MFTDIADSTKLKTLMAGATTAQRDAAFYKNIKSPHDKIVHKYVQAGQGHFVNPTGDGYCCVFTDAEEAVLSALHIQEQLRTNPIETPLGYLQVRIGLHTGLASPKRND